MSKADDIKIIYKQAGIKITSKDEIIIEQSQRIAELEAQLNKKPRPKAVKKTVYITSELNEQAEELGINFSLVLREALKKEIKRLRDE